MAEVSVAPPRSYWIISGLALVWNLIGLAAYVSQVTMTDEALRLLPDAQREFMAATPAWATAAFAVATTAGVLGSLLLLLRNSWAVPLFLVSLGAGARSDLLRFRHRKRHRSPGPGLRCAPGCNDCYRHRADLVLANRKGTRLVQVALFPASPGMSKPIESRASQSAPYCVSVSATRGGRRRRQLSMPL